MRVLVVSDSHGSIESLLELQQLYHGKVDEMFHCGDSELTNHDEALKHFLTVKGNCDWNGDFPEDIVHAVKGTTFFVTHGHMYNVKMSLMNLSYQAIEHNADIVLFGHSHVLGVEFVDGILYVNPGSILLPRAREEKTYCVIERKASVLMISFFDHHHQELIELRQQFQVQ
ncbi:metallophosphoesterase [Bacillus sp. 2205SS5-2]|uniref:metallophosphoesterase n=1 Tax=Bacillus sp. 2205SS5-2 TaxID=3109031 RepID=UPI003005FB9B